MSAYSLARKCLPPGLGVRAGSAACTRHRKPGPRGRRVGRGAALLLTALCGLGLVSTAGCSSEEAILLLIRPPSGVQLTQYEVKIQDRATRTLIYQSGIQPVAAVANGRDLFVEPLRLGLKLSKAGQLPGVRARLGRHPGPRGY